MGSTLLERWTSIWRTLGSEEVVTLRGPRGVVRGCSRMVQGWPGDRLDPSRVEGHERSEDMTDSNDLPSPTPDADSDPESTIEPIAESPSGPSDEALAARWKRVVGLLHDIGLLPVVGRDWVRPVPGGLEFKPLDGRAADEWLRFLDELAARLPEPARPAPGPGQLGLPFQPSSLHGLRRHLAVTR